MSHEHGHQGSHSPPQSLVEDAMFPRDRWIRVTVFAVTFVTFLVVPALLLSILTSDWFGVTLPGKIVGAWIGGFLFLKYILPRSIIKVEPNHAFVTINSFLAFIGQSNVYVGYGPGTHLSFWWEDRAANNNVHLGEANQDFNFKIVLRDGVTNFKGSIRLRPDYRDIMTFLGGVAVVAGEFLSLVQAQLSTMCANMTIEQARTSIADINETLHDMFVKGSVGSKFIDQSALESRFAIVVADVTVGGIELPEEVAKALSGLAEARHTSEGAALVLGFRPSDGKSAADHMNESVTAGTTSRDEVKFATDRFLQINGNIVGTTVSTNEWRLRLDAPPEIVEIFGNLAPDLIPLLRQMRGQGQNGPQQAQPQGGRRNRRN